MTFVKYSSDGKVIIQPAALILSSLEHEEKLEMHTLDNALVLLKDDMEVQEKFAVMAELSKLINSLLVEAITQLDDTPEDLHSISIPIEAFEDAGIDEGDLRVLADDGVVILVRDTQEVKLSPWTLDELARCGVTQEQMEHLLKEARADAE